MQTLPQDKNQTVMIVDDSLFMRDMLHTMLEVNGYTVLAEVSNGEEAIARYQDLRPMVTFMDVLMPRISGVDATKQILAIDKTAKVVMCSSLGHEDLIKAALESGARDVLFKPYKNDQLQEVMRRILQF
jgi:two-component system, chemotaxis family, chemotaxis protein CheY